MFAWFVLVLQLKLPTLCDPMDCKLPAPLSNGDSEPKEYWGKVAGPLQDHEDDPGLLFLSTCIGKWALYTKTPPGEAL